MTRDQYRFFFCMYVAVVEQKKAALRTKIVTRKIASKWAHLENKITFVQFEI